MSASNLLHIKPLGSQGLQVSQLGLGCMGMTAFYGGFNRAEQEQENLRAIAKTLELGINFFDTAWIYQSFGADGAPNTTNEELVGKAIAIHGRDKFIIATKFGIVPGSSGFTYSGKEETIRSQLADSLSRLGTDYIDLYYMHRMDPSTPIEETVAVLKSLVEEGKIRYIGLSECTPNELRRAHAIHPITAIQMEWSLQTRDIEKDLVPVARELGVGIVAYSPLGRGFLTSLNAFDALDDKDWRKALPRFSGENLEENRRRIVTFVEVANKLNCTPAQLALAWLLQSGDDVFPIFGSKSATRIAENVGAFQVPILSDEIRRTLEESVVAIGERYPAESLTATYQARL